MQSLPIVEIFDSVQGEGTMMGQACTFIRVAGCNLRCSWCDTKNSWVESLEEIGTKVIAAKCNLPMVVITGGEPCMHKGLHELVCRLKYANHYVCLETNGTLPTPKDTDWVTCSPKPNKYTIHDECDFQELKYVVTDELDFEQVVVPKLRLDVPVWLQPNGYDLAASSRKAYELVMNNPNYSNLKLGVQMHKIYDFR